MTILKFHEKYLSSCEGKKYVKEKLKRISTLLRSRAFLIKFVTVQDCHHHMAELLVKTAYALFEVKGFHIFDIRILIPVHANCIDSIHADLGVLVV